eukprot:COSAG05_NODE_677_length_7987_cov_37.034483_1_plen_38_part_10
MHKMVIQHMRDVVKPQILTPGLTVIPKCAEVQLATNKV